MDSPSTSAAAMKEEIARLTGKTSPKTPFRRRECHSEQLLIALLEFAKGYRRRLTVVFMIGAINRQKIHTPGYNPRQTTFYPGGRPRNNVYVNPDYKPPLRAVAPIPPAPRPPIPRPLSTHPDEKRDVVINGIAFETSGRSLVRKDCKSTSFLSRVACIVFLTNYNTF